MKLNGGSNVANPLLKIFHLLMEKNRENICSARKLCFVKRSKAMLPITIKYRRLNTREVELDKKFIKQKRPF